MTATQTGVPITRCSTCDHVHPITRRHCTACNAPSIFIGANGLCVRCT